ncbi:hypothetical protein, partial [Corynebacterium bovis]|uniref:hypothetical protein n=1 Tax=Corynebacterium bovis TaxID=36808 RepID=UPI002659962D
MVAVVQQGGAAEEGERVVDEVVELVLHRVRDDVEADAVVLEDGVADVLASGLAGEEHGGDGHRAAAGRAGEAGERGGAVDVRGDRAVAHVEVADGLGEPRGGGRLRGMSSDTADSAHRAARGTARGDGPADGTG